MTTKLAGRGEPPPRKTLSLAASKDSNLHHSLAAGDL
jgi:hypothetical protein